MKRWRKWPRATIVISGCTLLNGCSVAGEPIEDERVGIARVALTVEEAVTAGCSTAQIEALSLQIIGQGNCIQPGAFSELSATPNVNFGSAVLPFLEEPARDALAEALAENTGTAMQINSMFRTVAQQYLLYRWFQTGSCGVGLAASPGNSNHETGLAIDIQQYDTWRPLLAAKDFSWFGAGDVVHFDYVGPGAIDYRDLDVLAFQELWNINNPADVILEDGIYGPQTQARIQLSPAEGFPEGPACGPLGQAVLNITAAFADAADPFADGPSAGVTDLFEGGTYELVVTVSNTGVTTAAAVTLTLASDEGLTLEANSVALGDIALDSSVAVSVAVTAASYSVDVAEPLSIGLSIAPDASAVIAADVYSSRRWEWNGGRLEGWSPIGEGSVQLGQLALVVAAGSSAVSPTVSVPADSVRAIRLVGSADSASTLVVNSDAGENVFNVDLTDGEALLSLEGVRGTITSLRFDAAATLTLDAVRLEAEVDSLVEEPASESDCGCRLPGRSGPHRGWGMLLALGAMAAGRRMRPASNT